MTRSLITAVTALCALQVAASLQLPSVAQNVPDLLGANIAAQLDGAVDSVKAAASELAAARSRRSPLGISTLTNPIGSTLENAVDAVSEVASDTGLVTLPASIVDRLVAHISTAGLNGDTGIAKVANAIAGLATTSDGLTNVAGLSNVITQLQDALAVALSASTSGVVDAAQGLTR